MSALIQTQAALDEAVVALSGATRVALDTEFHGERTWFPELMLLQLRPDRASPLLIDGRAGLDLRPLGAALAGVEVVVHGGATDIALLQRHSCVRPARVRDTQVIAGFTGGGYPTRLQDLLARSLGVHLAKTETLSDWSRRPLSEAQVRYAELDVEHLVDLADELDAKLSPDHRRWCAAATAEIVDEACSIPEPEEAWARLHGVASMGETERRALRALAAWRERTARERNVPRHTIVADSLLLDLCRRRPLGVEALRGNRRMPSQVVKLWGEELVAALRDAREDEGPAPRPAPPRRQLDLARAGLRAVEVETGIAAELLADDRLLGEYLFGVSPEGWRAEVLGGSFAAYLRGEVGLRMDGRWIGIQK